MSRVSETQGSSRRGERFSRARAVSHWLLTLVVLIALASGLVGLANIADSDPAKVPMVRVHMLVGLLVAAALLFHLVVTVRSTRPPPLPSGSRPLDLLAGGVHQLLRLCVLVLVISGVVTVVKSGLAGVVFAGSSDRIPEIASRLPSFTAHAIVARVLLALAVLHLLGTIYHQFVRKDGVLQRMWPFGRDGDRA